MVNVSVQQENRVNIAGELREQVKLVILDIQSPDFNVVSLLRALSDADFSPAWILLANQDDFKAVDQLVPRPYFQLHAPLDPLQLLHLVNDVLSKSESTPGEYGGKQSNGAQGKPPRH